MKFVVILCFITFRGSVADAIPLVNVSKSCIYMNSIHVFNHYYIETQAKHR